MSFYIDRQLFRFDDFRDAASRTLSDRDRFYTLDCDFLFYSCPPYSPALLPIRVITWSFPDRLRNTDRNCALYHDVVVRVSGSRKPLFKFANYLMTGHPNKASAIFNRPAGFRSHLRNREKCPSRASDVIALWLCCKWQHFFASLQTSVKKSSGSSKCRRVILKILHYFLCESISQKIFFQSFLFEICQLWMFINQLSFVHLFSTILKIYRLYFNIHMQF